MRVFREVLPTAVGGGGNCGRPFGARALPRVGHEHCSGEEHQQREPLRGLEAPVEHEPREERREERLALV